MSAPAALDASDRSALRTEHTWNLADLYPSVDAWREARMRVVSALPGLGRFRGRLGTPAVLADALSLRAELEKEVARLSVFAAALGDQDTRVAAHQGMQQEMLQLATALAAEASFIEPELLALPGGAIERALADAPALAPHAFGLRDLVRRARHTLSGVEERLLAAVRPLASAPEDIFAILANADFPYPTATTSEGRAVRVDQAGYARLRASVHRADRQTAMTAFFAALGGFNGTLGMTLNGSVQKTRFLANARGYGSSLEMVLDGPNIPVPVYRRLIDGVNRHLPVFHRYLRLRRRMLDLPDLHYHDLYAPLVPDADESYSPEAAMAAVRAAFTPLGPEYVDVVARACAERWIDWHPATGKRSGAYSEGAAYDVHPYILLNYQGKLHDVSTLAHELGHTLHSWYSNRTQPYTLAAYHTFVAEVASTFNEELLVDDLLRRHASGAMRRALLGHYLENIKSTVVRQTQFAEFELRMHEMAQEGEPITGEALSRLYLEIVRRYYGHGAGVCTVAGEIAHEWSYIPHFYRDFYVFQYATSFAASVALADRVRRGEPGTVERYLAFISAGGSKYPIDLLRDAGVDMTTDEPIDLTFAKMAQVMDELEALIGD
ncbi:MAG: oligoendopeptidase F [Acidimicrobiia bacterium]|nr:oligoendopeptidase F [Acidimicrobiia bacterium]